MTVPVCIIHRLSPRFVTPSLCKGHQCPCFSESTKLLVFAFSLQACLTKINSMIPQPNVKCVSLSTIMNIYWALPTCWVLCQVPLQTLSSSVLTTALWGRYKDCWAASRTKHPRKVASEELLAWRSESSGAETAMMTFKYLSGFFMLAWSATWIMAPGGRSHRENIQDATDFSGHSAV